MSFRSTQILLLLLIPYFSFAQFNPWSPASSEAVTKLRSKINSEGLHAFDLDVPQLEKFLYSKNIVQQELALPFPDGTTRNFQVTTNGTMHPDLAERYPGIRTFTVWNPLIGSGRIDIGANGFHGMIRMLDGETVVVEPDKNRRYLSFHKSAWKESERNPFSCAVKDEIRSKTSEIQNRAAGDCQLRKYRLAVSTTGEYSNYHGDSIPQVLSAVVTAINQINGLFETDLGIMLELIPDNDKLIFFNPSTDPFNNNNNGQMLGQNQQAIDNIIGRENYDIGHVFTTNEGGIASLRSVCTFRKAQGVTGREDPIGNPFVIDYVAHEMGHQFGANHTQNNSCQRSLNTAVEPGSGSTIMGYAGICSPNSQNFSDDYFHAINLEEIATFLLQGDGGGCAVIIPNNNQAPVLNDVPNYILPVSTPFVLTADATDADGDTLTYCWEQMDAEPAQMPPVSTSTDGPAFRSLLPVTNPARTFPALEAIVNQIDPEWEELPSVSREMNFRCTVRDNHAGLGCTSERDTRLTFTVDAGPFLVLEPNDDAVTWFINDVQTVRWDVADTDQAPVSCSLVNVLLSSDGGFTYPDTLAAGIPNTGSADVLVPDRPGTQTRVRVACATSIFFDISNEDFTIIKSPVDTVSVFPLFASEPVCGNNDVSYKILISALGDFNETVNLTLSGLPAGVTANFIRNPITPSDTIDLTFSNLQNLPSDNYVVDLNLTSGTINEVIRLSIPVFNAVPVAIDGTFPTEGTANFSVSTPLSWNDQETSLRYQLQVATNPAFGNSIILDVFTENNFYQLMPLAPAGIYYWRVRAINPCGTGPFSDVLGFQVAGQRCNTLQSAETNITISEAEGDTITSELVIDQSFDARKIGVNVNIDHSWVGDLAAYLLSPNNTRIDLFNRPGFPNTNFGCGGQDLDIFFVDDAPNSPEDLENTCRNSGVAIAGTYRAIDVMAILLAEELQGTWRLVVEDAASPDGGQINNWGLNICEDNQITPFTGSLEQQTLQVPQGGFAIITQEFLQTIPSDDEADIRYLVRSEPERGHLINRVGDTLRIGSVFSQQMIDELEVAYYHNGNSSNTDRFLFDLVVSDTFWLANQTFNIQVLPAANIVATLDLEAAISCAGDSTGQVVIFASGGTAPLRYRVNDGAFQTDSVFTGLPAGMHVFTIQDANNTEEQLEVTLTEPDRIEVETVVNFRRVTVTASGGTGNLRFKLDNNTFGTRAIFTNLTNGPHTITVIDANGCTETVEVVIDVPVLGGSIEFTDSLACATDRTGQIILTPESGVPPYDYRLFGVPFQTDSIFNDLGPGSYTGQVRDSIGQLFTLPEVNIISPPAIRLSLSTAADTIFVDASGGAGTLTFSLDDQNYQADTLFAGLANGIYTVFVLDENGCSLTADIEVMTTSLTNLLGAQQWALFPNPAQSDIQIQLSNVSTADNNWRLELYDALGRRLMGQVVDFTGTRGQLQTTISVQDIPEGFYLIRLRNQEFSGTKELIILR